jgi:uncharacterized membrane protein
MNLFVRRRVLWDYLGGALWVLPTVSVMAFLVAPGSAVRSHTWVAVAMMPQVTGSRAAGMAAQVAKV